MGLFFMMSFITVVILPLVAIAMMRMLDMVSSLEMHDRKERIGPLIATATLYIWYYLNIKGNYNFPTTLSIIALGGAIAICMAFFLNNFTKISLHTTSAGAFVAGLSIIALAFGRPVYHVSLWGIGSFEVSSIFVIFWSIVVAGLIGTSRLVLKAHSNEDVYGGYLIGAASMLLAFVIVIK